MATRIICWGLRPWANAVRAWWKRGQRSRAVWIALTRAVPALVFSLRVRALEGEIKEAANIWSRGRTARKGGSGTRKTSGLPTPGRLSREAVEERTVITYPTDRSESDAETSTDT